MRKQRYILYVRTLLHWPFTLIKMFILAINVADDSCNSYFRDKLARIIAESKEEKCCNTDCENTISNEEDEAGYCFVCDTDI